MTIVIKHPEINIFCDALLKYSCKRFEDWMTSVESESKKYEIEEDQYKFKGDMFEIFGQFFIKYFENILGIHNFEPNIDNDFGVDGGGSAYREGKPAAIQFKYRANPTEVLQYKKDLSTFFAQAPFAFKVTEQENLILVSTTYETDYKIVEALHGKITHINRNQIEVLVNNKNSNFWTDLYESVKASYIEAQTRSKKPRLWKPQEKGLGKINGFLHGSDLDRGQVIMPTGGGKTRLEVEAINLSIDKGGLIHIIMAPRIALLNQILRDCWAYKDRAWEKLLIRSGNDERLKFFSDEEYTDTEAVATTNEESILYKIKHSLSISEPLLMFSTYHSADKIGKCLKEIGIASDLNIGDEAHNMATAGFNELLDPSIVPAKKWIFFTATRRIGGRLGMDNTKRFGEMIYQVQPAELMKEGIIVPPRIHVMYYKGNDERYDIDFILAAINKHMKEFSPKEFRLIVACRGVPKAHNIADALREQKILKDFFIATISSNQKLMIEETAKLSLRNTSSARNEIFERYVENNYAILLHYNILSEGIDLPGTTAVMPLRDLMPISVVQFIGRSLRLTAADRKNHLAGKIVPGNTEGWEKPFGWVILPDDKDGEFREQTKSIIYTIRRSEFNPDISYTAEDDTSITKSIISGIEDLFPGLPEVAKEFRENVLHHIDREIKHEIEEEELALIKQDQTVLEFAEWKGN